MTTVRGTTTGTEFPLAPGTELGRGAEGVAYRFGPLVVKVFHAPPARDETDKWATLARHGKGLAGFAWAQELVTDAGGTVVGHVSRYVPGDTLAALTDRRATAAIPVPTKVDLAAAVAAAVAGVHALPPPRVVLGDVLKAANLVVDGADATFVDAGAASVFGYRTTAGHLTDAVCPYRTPGYTPPEALAHPDARPAPADDLFALGVTLFELVFGRPPTDPKPSPACPGIEPDEAVRRGVFPRYVRTADFPPPAYDPVDPPAEVEDLFRAAFLAPPHQRPSGADWAARLARWRTALTPPPVARRRFAWPRLAVNVAAADRAVSAGLLVTASLLLTRWAVVAAPGAVDAARGYLAPPEPPAKPVGPPLFQELFR